MPYSFKKTLRKVIRRVLQFGLPMLLGYLANYHPTVLSLTIGGVLEIVLDWAKHTSSK